MQKLLNILAYGWSVLLHPMLMPLYGMLLYCQTMQNLSPQLPAAYMLVCLIGTTVLTIVIPFTLLLYLKHKGHIDSLNINNPKQRTTPYIYTLICYGFWAYFLYAIMHLPILLLIIAIGTIVALGAVSIINRWWKISAHLTGIGGLLGGICSFAVYYSTLPRVLICGILVIALLLMYARLYLNAHTPMQVVCGFLLGLTTTFLPILIIYA